jgi:lambda family phage tail tape measure protein
MATEESKLQLGVTVAGGAEAKAELSSIGASAKKMGVDVNDAGKGLGDAFKPLVTGSQEATEANNRATNSVIRNIKRLTVEEESLGKGQAARQIALAQAKGNVDLEAIKPYVEKLKAAEAATIAAQKAMGGLGMSAKQTTAAMRQVPAQFTDIFVSLQGGQNPLTVLLQQGGQLKDVFGGIAPAARALGGYILGLVNPFSVAAVAVAGLGYAFLQGVKENEAYTNALILSGNAAGTTVGQLQMMARGLGAIGSTQGQAAAALVLMAQSGAVGANNLERFTQSALIFERATGTAIAETVKKFEALKDAPLAASLKLNESTNYLTVSLYRQIKALEDQGKATEAAGLAQRSFSDVQEFRAKEILDNLGVVEKAWNAVTLAIRNAGDALTDIGRSKAPEVLLEEARKRQAALSSPASLFEGLVRGDKYSGPMTGNAESTTQYMESLREQVRMGAKAAELKAQEKVNVQSLSEWEKEGAKYKSKQLQMQEEINKATVKGAQLVADGLITQGDLQARLAGIREKYRDKDAESLTKAKLAFDISAEKNALAEQLSAFANASRILDTLRGNGWLNEKEYFDAKQALLRGETEAQRNTLEAEIARFDQSKATGAEAIRVAQQRAAVVSQLAILEASAGAKQFLLNDARNDSLNRLTASYLRLTQVQAEYLDGQNLSLGRELAGVGKGESARRKDVGNAQITDRFDGQIRDEENRRALQKQIQGALTADQEAEYNKRIDLLEDYKRRSLQSFGDAFDQMKVKQMDWTKGSSEAIYNYLSDVANVAKTTENLMTMSFKGIEDALVSFVTTGKLSFKSLADSVVAEITRIIIKQQIANMLAASMGSGGGRNFFESTASSIFTALLGGASGGGSGMPDSVPTRGGRAMGGPVESGSLYEVNEKGPEVLSVGGKNYLMMGAQSGTVTPNANTAAPAPSGNTYLTVNVAPPQGSSRETAQQWGAAAGKQIQYATRRNG